MKKSIRNLILGLILLIIIVYISGTLYLRSQAKERVDQTIQQIEKSPAIKTVQYQSISVDLISFLRNQIAIKGLRITLTQMPNDPILIQRVQLSHYRESSHHVPLGFALTIENLHVSSLKHTLIDSAKLLSRYGQQHSGSPILINLKSPSEVIVYRNKTILFHQKLTAGKHDLPTNQFPVGTYHVNVVTRNLSGKTSQHKQLFVKSQQAMPFLSLLSKLTQGSLLHINGQITYQAAKTTLDINLSALWKSQKILHYTISLHPFKFTQRPDNVNAILSPLMKAYMETSSIKLHIKGDINQTTFPKKSAPYQILSDLGYQTIPYVIKMQGQSSLDSKQSTGSASIDLKNVARLSWQVRTHLGKPRPIGEHLQELQQIGIHNTKELPKIALISLTYQDRSLIPHILKAAAKKMHQTPEQLKAIATSFLSNMSKQTHVAAVQSAIQQLLTFIDKPQSLTVALKPTKPFEADIFNAFIQKQNHLTQRFDKRLKNTPKNQQQALKQAHQKRTDQATEAFLNQIGFIIQANTATK